MRAGEFYSKLAKRCQQFAIFWERKHGEKPDIYPVELTEAEWWEQFSVWSEGEL